MLTRVLFLASLLASGCTEWGQSSSNPCPDGTEPKSEELSRSQEFWCVKNGQRHGPFLQTHVDGSPAAEGTYRFGKEEGRWTSTHENGQAASTGMYSKGRRIGEWTWWHAGGAKAEEGSYIAGQREGRWTSWYPTGRLRDEGLYQADRKTGDWAVYNDDDANELSHIESWQNGEPFRETPLSEDQLAAVAWLHGCWHNEGRSTSECWRTAGARLNGGRTDRRGEASIPFALVGIGVVDGRVVYRTKQTRASQSFRHDLLWDSDTDAVSLDMAAVSDNRLEFRGKGGFPDRVLYERSGRTMGLTVSGTVNGEPYAESWTLKYQSLHDTLRQNLRDNLRHARQGIP